MSLTRINGVPTLLEQDSILKFPPNLAVTPRSQQNSLVATSPNIRQNPGYDETT